jgi:hypothetical protein
MKIARRIYILSFAIKIANVSLYKRLCYYKLQINCLSKQALTNTDSQIVYHEA